MRTVVSKWVWYRKINLNSGCWKQESRDRIMPTNLKPIIVSHRDARKQIRLWSASITRTSLAYQTMTNAQRSIFITQTIYTTTNQMLLLTHFVENQFRDIQGGGNSRHCVLDNFLPWNIFLYLDWNFIDIFSYCAINYTFTCDFRIGFAQDRRQKIRIPLCSSSPICLCVDKFTRASVGDATVILNRKLSN